jgi:hypothetical protein
MRGLGPAALFRRDLGRVWAGCRFDWRLPTLVVGLSLITWLPSAAVAGDRDLGWIGMLGEVVYFATLGVLGAERAWFIAADRRERFTWSEVRGVARVVWFRYVGLGVYAAVVGAILLVPIVLLAGVVQLALGGGDYEVALRVGIVVTGLLLEIALTFATVVRVFSDITAGDAIRHSLHVIRVEWPSSLWYALAAPLTVHALVLALPPSTVGVGVRVATLTVDAVIRLFCVGAVALFWADRYMMIGIDS